MIRFTKKDFEGNGTQFSIGDIKLRVWSEREHEYHCTATIKISSLKSVTCRSKCNHFKAAIKSAVSKLAWYLIEFEYTIGINDHDGGEWFSKAFMGENST